MPAGLGAVDEHERAVLVRDVRDVGDVLDRAGDVAGVLADDRARRGLGDKRLDRFGVDEAGLVGLGEYDLDAARGEHVERAGDGVVLGGAGDHAIARLDQAEQHEVHRLGAARLEEQVLRVGHAEKAAISRRAAWIARAVSTAML